MLLVEKKKKELFGCYDIASGENGIWIKLF